MGFSPSMQSRSVVAALWLRSAQAYPPIDGLTDELALPERPTTLLELPHDHRHVALRSAMIQSRWPQWRLEASWIAPSGHAYHHSDHSGNISAINQPDGSSPNPTQNQVN